MHDDGKYVLHSAYKTARDGVTQTSMLVYSKSKTGTSDYDVLKIIQNNVDADDMTFDMSNLTEYEIYTRKDEMYITDSNNQFLKECLESINIDLNACAEKDYNN